MENSGNKSLKKWSLGLWLRRFGFFLSLFAILAALALTALYGLHREDLPDVVAVNDYRPSIKSKVFAQNGELIAEFGVHERIIATKNEIPKLVAHAFISSEDKNFYRHHGIDLGGMANAIVEALRRKRSNVRGASTLTQQLAKGLLVKDLGYDQGTARTIARKVKEAILARRLEMNLSKDDILWMYLNEVYLGHGSYGIKAAARTYFQKDLKDLSLGEIALIAGLPQAPSRLSPQVNRDAALSRQRYVLNRMREDAYITDEELKRALDDNKNLVIYGRENNFRKQAPYFSEAVRRMVIEKFGESRVYEDGLKIFTTVDLDQERIMQNTLKTGLIDIDKRQGFSGPIYRPVDDVAKEKAKGAIAIINKDMPGPFRLAMVESIDAVNNFVSISTGNKKGNIPLALMRWARTRDATVNYEAALLRSVNGIFAPGDVILVKEENSDGGHHVFSLEQEPSIEGAMFAMEYGSGYVTALNGGYSFDRSEFNRIFQACRQPGSLFKPIVYSAAIALKKYTPATLVLDAPLTFYDGGNESTWHPKNFNQGYKGEVTVREAMMRSMNIPTLNVTADVGISNVIDWAKKLGLTTKLKPELGTGIGSSCVMPFELAQVFSVFANMGVRVPPIMIKEIKDRDDIRISSAGHGSDPWLKRSDRIMFHVDNVMTPKPRVIDEEVAYTTHYLLTEVAKHGTAARTAALGRQIAAKTGTTNDSFDTWFLGYSRNLMTLIWIGNDTMSVPLGVYEQGAKTALPLFNKFMGRALYDLPDIAWPMPTSLCLAQIDARTGLRVASDYPLSFSAPFFCGKEPPLMDSLPSQSIEQAMEIMGGI